MSNPEEITAFQQDVLIFQAILDRAKKCTFDDDKQRKICERIVGELTEKELDVAAETSYAYWYMTTQIPLQKLHETANDESKTELRKVVAMRECRRHCIVEHCDYEKTMSSLKQGIQFRLEYDIHSLRSCMSADTPSTSSSTDTQETAYQDNNKSKAEMKSLIVDELMNKQQMVVRGHGKGHSAIIYKFRRTVITSETSDRGFQLANFYVAERSLAITEYLSKGKEETVIVIGDTTGYTAKNAPPKSMMKGFVQVLQKLYPARLKKLLLLEPPFWMRALFSIVYPFLSYHARHKVEMVSGYRNETTQKAIFGPLVDASQATPMILADGQLTAELSIEKFLVEVPFHRLYDE